MKMKVKCLLLATLLLILTTANVSAERVFEGVTLRCMMEPHPATEALKKIVGEFEEETGMDVILEVVPYEHLTEKALLSFTSRSGDYDVIMDDAAFHAGGYVRAGYLEALDNFIEDPSIDNSQLDLHDFMGKFLQQLTFDGKLYGLPLYGESTFLMYRKDLFEKYGVKVPETLDELKEAAEKLTIDTDSNGEIDVYGITMRGRRGIHIVYTWTGFLWAFGGRWLDENMKPVVNSPEAVKATEFYVDLLRNYGPPGVSNYGWEENRVAFEQGHAAMTIDATVNGALAEDPEKSKVAGKVGYAPFPEGPGGDGSSIATHALYIPRFSRHKKAAWEFIKWATSKETQARCLQVNPHSGVTSRTVLASDLFRDKYGTFADAQIEAIERGNPEYVPRLGETFELTSRVGVALSEVLTGVKGPRKALDEANEAVYEILSESGYYD